MVMDAGGNMLAAVKAGHPENIICLEYMIHLVVKDALGRGGGGVKNTEDTATLNIQSLLKTCQCLATHFLHSILSAV